MIGRRVALAAGAVVLGAVPVARGVTASSSSSSATFFVTPKVECVVQTGSTYTAWFGYTNSKSSALTYTAGGLLNFFLPHPKDRGQPSTFQPGSHRFQFSVPFTSGHLTWFVAGKSAKASSSTPRCSMPQITTEALDGGTIGAAYGPVVVQATGGIEPRSFAATGLPDGLTIDSEAGAISGTPTEPGTFSVDVTVTDKIGQTATKNFSLVIEGELLACGDDTTAGGEGSPSATLTLQAEGCMAPVPVILRVGDREVELVKSESTNTFTMEIAWPAEDNANPVPVSEIDYDGVGGNDAVEVVWCPDFGELPPGQSWCLLEQHTVIVGGGQMQVTELYFGKNDPTWTRR
jgi:hypothetical protein